MRHAEQHFLVSGAGTGIGKAIALRLASEGARLTLIARNADRLEQTAKEAKELGAADCLSYSCDIRDRKAVDATFSAAAEILGPFRGLVANSGVGGPNFDGPDDRFDDLIQTNLNGTYYCMRAAVRHFFPGPKNRHLVVISSCLARFGVSGYSGYCASKAALLGLVRALAMELSEENVQVNAICPGWVETEMSREGIQGMAEGMGVTYHEAFDTAMKSVPLGRMSQPAEIAGLVSWLLSEDARGMTGQGLDMNGGSWMG